MDIVREKDVVWSHIHGWTSAWAVKGSAGSELASLARDGAIVDGRLRLAVCGDWVYIASGRGGNIEGAFLSGVAAAEKLAGCTGASPQRGGPAAPRA